MKRHSYKRWILCLLFAATGGLLLRAADNDAPPKPEALPAGTNHFALSGTALHQLAPWQQHLTLGPGDLLNISLLDMPDTARTDVPVGPDGRINFLQARDIPATGLTIDELRAKLDQALAKYYQTARTVVVPAAFRSKKYYVLGAVVGKGVYAFDRPVTVIEAIARAGGLETGLYDLRAVELADLSRSFLVRNGQRMPVDFERLFQQGDLSQNIALAPDDYLYFASANANEIYVLGDVVRPGVVAFAPKPTVIGAIAARGGFSDTAYKGRVLVVRGSLNHPESFVVQTGAILAGKAPDVRLQPRDIVYVSANPWWKVADLLDTATRAFVSSFIVTATTRNVGPLITSPLIR